MGIDYFFPLIVNGIVAGSLYGLLGLGLVIVYRATNVVNLAHGEIVLLFTYISWSCSQYIPLPLAILASGAVAFVFGFLLEFAFLRRIESWQQLNVVVLTVAFGTVIYPCILWKYGGTPIPFPELLPKTTFGSGNYVVSFQAIGIVGTTLILASLLFLFFKKSKVGMAIRAASQNRVGAQLAGISVGKVYGISWGLSAALGTIAGGLMAPSLFLSPNMMQSIIIFAFAGITLGGLDSPIGALVGGVVIGIFDAFVGEWSLVGSDLKLVATMGFLILVLLFLPQGMFGDRKMRKV